MRLRLLTTILLGSTLAACATTTPSTTAPVAAATQKTAIAVPTAPAVKSEPVEAPTKIAKNMQSVAVSTTPEGASCTIKAGDETLGTVVTPSNAVIKRMNWKFGADVTCSKEGFVTKTCLLYTSPSPRDKRQSRMPSSA